MPVTASIIISTYNRSHLLKRLLLALPSQTLAPDSYEVLVVDDGSADDTADVCREMMGKITNLKYLSTRKNVGLPKAQNLAIREARGQHLLFTDDDCIPEKDWAVQLSSALDREPIVAGAINTTRSNFSTVCHNISEFHPFMPGRSAGYTAFIAGANMGLRRTVIKELGGFLEDRPCCPDMEMGLRARERGYAVYYDPAAVVTHDPERTNLKSIFKYSADHASSTILLRHKYQTVLRTPFILKSPALILAAAPVIALKVTAGIYLRNYRLARYIWTAPVIYALKLAWCWGAARGLRNRNDSGRDA